MKKIAIYCLVALLLNSCVYTKYPFRDSYGGVYSYKYELLKPTASSNLKHTDDKIDINFSVGITEISFNLKNLSSETMKINWDNVSIVIHDKTEKVMHGGVKFMHKDLSQPPTSIPAGAQLSEVILPNNNVKLSSFGEWVASDLFAIDDHFDKEKRALILANKGALVTLYFPIEQNNKMIEYTFVFRVSEVIPFNKRAKSTKG